MTEAIEPLDRSAVRQHFSVAASTFNSAAVLHQRVATELVDRLQFVRLSPATVLDLGCATGFCTALMTERYPQARFTGLDLCHAMLVQHPERDTDRVTGDAEALPLFDRSFNLVVSNLLLPWCQPLDLFSEVCRILQPGGVFAFSSFGPDTLKELRAAWSTVDDLPHVHAFHDMHILGDMLLSAGFAEPVVDSEILTLTYNSLGALSADLRATGGCNALAARRRTLTGKHRAKGLKAAYETFRGADGRLPSTWEVVYGVAWRPERAVSGVSDGIGVPVRLGD